MTRPSQPTLAAQYVRMSTDSQDLSPELQRAAISAYALQNEIRIVETFFDEGRSGLTLQKRPAMKRLLQAVTAAERAFSVILVYDVSRWGRFQDPDASAYYEYHCRLHGVDLRYVEEPFSGIEPSPFASLFKSMKRTMAAEFSRELGMKVRAGQATAIDKGYQLGTLPCLGVSRVAVSKSDSSQRVLRPNEHKAGHREHVRWILGPLQEILVVRRIFDLYAKTEISVVDLARLLEGDGVRTRDGRPVTEWMLYGFLRSESVLGNFVWGRAENKKRRSEDDERFRRICGIMEPIVSRETFDACQAKLAQRKHTILTKGSLLQDLRRAIAANPRIRGGGLKAAGCACRESYVHHFGSMLAAWAAAGSSYPERPDAEDYAEMERTASTGAHMCSQVAEYLVAAGVDCTRHTREDRRGQTLLINGKTALRIQVIWKKPRYDSKAWCLRKIYKEPFDWVLVIRVGDDLSPVDSLLLRRDDYFREHKWLPEELGGDWQYYRSTLDMVPAMHRL